MAAVAPQNQQKKKHLPKRASNAHRKAYRASLWAKQKARKAKRRDAQHSRHMANVAAGLVTCNCK